MNRLPKAVHHCELGGGCGAYTGLPKLLSGVELAL